MQRVDDEQIFVEPKEENPRYRRGADCSGIKTGAAQAAMKMYLHK